ncbi:MAG: hypothetical protein E7598_05140 [Ruminococcaceae bacterium]|nr:hypothetical protein [Oscillospiraceae bacterium]
MENKLTKEEKMKEKVALSNAVTGKMVVVFAALLLAIAALVYFGERMILSPLVVAVAQIVAGLGTIAALVWCSASAKGKKDYRFNVFSPSMVLGLCASTLFVTLMYPTVDASRTIISVIALAVLFFVYQIYPVDFFICSVSVISGFIAATVMNNQGVTLFKDLVVFAIYAAIMAICIGFFAKLAKGGKIKIGKNVVKKPRGMINAAVIASFAVSLIAVLGVLALGGYLMYFIATACVVYFVIAIIYTVKLM